MKVGFSPYTALSLKMNLILDIRDWALIPSSVQSVAVARASVIGGGCFGAKTKAACQPSTVRAFDVI